jgi:putative ABC transport system permease protein
MERIETTGNQIIIISVITAGMIVLFMMLYTVKERTKEIGILKALGFTGNSILSQFVIEGTVIGLFGGIFGVTIGWVAAPSLSGLLLPSSEVYATSTPSIVLIALALCLTLVLGAFGSLYPAYQASKKSPMEAMRNE